MQHLLNSAKSVEAAIDPNNRMTFLLDWELTMKCNLDCDYCSTGIYGGHDNSTAHPPLDQCLATIDFMFAYVDHVMNQRRAAFKSVILNVYGGEALNHPDIVPILQAVRRRYQEVNPEWRLKITTTTNLIVSSKKLDQLIELIDEFTASYHTNSTLRQKEQFNSNVLKVNSAKPIKCVILMHADPELFQDAQNQIDWCTQHSIKHLPRQLDRPVAAKEFDYQPQQVVWFEKLYHSKSFGAAVELTDTDTDSVDLSRKGRACCGGRQLCVDQNHRERHFFVNNNFHGWHCSVDQFFLYIKQVNGEVYVNKDCKMNYQGQIGPIGTLANAQAILQQQRQGTPTIVCAKSRCLCGLCAPKAKDLADYNEIMLKYHS